MTVPYISERITGQQAIDQIADVTACTVENACEAYLSAAADGKLTVWMLGAVWGPNGRIDRYREIERWEPEPNPVPVGYWKRSAKTGSLYIMTDLHRFEVSRADVDRLWSNQPPPTEITSPSGVRTNRQRDAEEEARKWLHARAGQPKKLKAEALRELRELYPALSQTAFYRAWHDCAPSEWTRQGRPKKPV